MRSSFSRPLEDFLIKPVSSDTLLHAVEQTVARHEAARGRKIRLEIVHARIARSTSHERQVFDLVVRGRMNKQIADELGTTERTIKAHRQRVMEKMQVQTLPILVSPTERVGLLGGTQPTDGLPSRAIDIRTIDCHPLASVGSFQPSRIVNVAVALRGHSEWQPGGIVLPR